MKALTPPPNGVYCKTCSSKDEYIASLENEVTELSDDAVGFREELRIMEEQYSEEVASLRGEVRGVREHRDEIVEKLTGQLTHSDKAIKNLKSENKNLLLKIRRLEDKLESDSVAHSPSENGEATLKALQEENEKLRQENTLLGDALAELRSAEKLILSNPSALHDAPRSNETPQADPDEFPLPEPEPEPEPATATATATATAEVSSEQRYDGLIIKNHCVNDADSKARASKSLYGWQRASLTAREWVGQLQAGVTIQPSLFKENAKGKLSHAKAEWQETHIICADADGIQGIEYHEDGTDKFPEGVPAWQEKGKLSQMYPRLKDIAYAVTESVSSMTEAKPPPHRRFRIIFIFDEPITSVEHYNSVLKHLHRLFPIIPDVERSPAQPVFGNSREGFDGAWIAGNTLKLSDYPIISKPSAPKPLVVKQPTRPVSGKHEHYGEVNATQRKYRNNLHQMLSDSGVATIGNPDSRGRQRVTCVFNASHTGAFVKEDNDGYPLWSCDHDGCLQYRFNDFAKKAGIFVEYQSTKSTKRSFEEAEYTRRLEFYNQYVNQPNQKDGVQNE